MRAKILFSAAVVAVMAPLTQAYASAGAAAAQNQRLHILTVCAGIVAQKLAASIHLNKTTGFGAATLRGPASATGASITLERPLAFDPVFTFSATSDGPAQGQLALTADSDWSVRESENGEYTLERPGFDAKLKVRVSDGEIRCSADPLLGKTEIAGTYTDNGELSLRIVGHWSADVVFSGTYTRSE